MKALTERQYQRRENILATARDLITKHGYDGVTMRDLAEKSHVTPKTLYHQFGNKEKLLQSAIEERFRHTYQAIVDHEIKKGIDKLFYIIENIANSTRKNSAYARALTPILSSRRNDPFASIRLNTYRKAIQQIADEGDFVAGIDVEMVAQLVYRHVTPVYINWYTDHAKFKTEDFTKFDLSLLLSSITKGYTHQKVTKTAKTLQKTLQSLNN